MLDISTQSQENTNIDTNSLQQNTQEDAAYAVSDLFSGATNISGYHNDLDKFTRKKIVHLKNKQLQKENLLASNYIRKKLLDSCRSIIHHYLEAKNITVDLGDIVIDQIDRQQFNADLTIKIPPLIRQYKKEYQTVILPDILNHLKDIVPYIQGVEQKGMYANITLTNEVLYSILEQVKEQGKQYGENSNHKGDTIIAEYSSPNAAKHLHAGHIRSTVIGQILGNIYSWNGYGVHRLNHINDWGGFGELIVGYERRADLLYTKGYKGNDLSFMVYTIYRKAEKAVDTIHAGEIISSEDEAFLQEYFPHTSPQELIGLFEEYKKQSIATFHGLEAGGEKEFSLWKKIYRDSLVAFDEFYSKLGVDHDFVIGESFYEKKGKQIVQEGMESGIILHFTAEAAEAYYQTYLSEQGENISETIKQQKYNEIQQDIGSYVALLDNYERYVVMRSDGASIYSTRDLGCLRYRCEEWDPDTIMYEVGQEQADHFNKLFETGRKFGWDTMADGRKRNFLHISHGFYVDEGSKKKLSSRAGANNVLGLLTASQEYFNKLYSSNTNFTPEELDTITKTLGKASVIINDIRKSRMSPVYVHPDIDQTLAGFEKSGGPYLMYTLCRAKSIIRKYESLHTEDNNRNINISESQPDTLETDIIKKIALFPDIVEKAALMHEPSIIIDYAYQLTQNFNTLYTTKKNIVENPVGMEITRAYIILMTNIFTICNIQPLDRM